MSEHLQISKKIILIFFFFIIFISPGFILENLFSQTVQQEWVRQYTAGQGINHGLGIALDKSGYVYVIDNSYIGLFQPYAYKLIKYSTSGVQQWVQQFGENGNTLASCFISVDDSDKIFITSSDDVYYRTLKYDSSGILLWERFYNGTNNPQDTNVPTALTIDKYSNVYVTGESVGIGTHLDYCTIKYNSSGTQLWIARYDQNNGVDIPHAIGVDDSGNVYVTGESEVAYGKSIIITIKYNSFGEFQWLRKYGNTGNPFQYSNIGRAICIGVNNGIYITGSIIGSLGGFNVITLKYSPTGILLWDRDYGEFEGRVITRDDTDNVYIGGMTSINSRNAFLTIKYDSTGIQKWARGYTDSLSVIGRGCSLYDIVLDNLSNVYVAGTDVLSIGFPSDYSKGLILKYTPVGELEWTAMFDYNQHQWAGFNSICVDRSENVYVTGSSLDTALGSLCITIKYSQLIGIQPNSNKIPESYKLYQNYPNPFNATTKIDFAIPKDGFVTLRVYDILGREVSDLVNEFKMAGYYNVQIDASNLASGLYFYRINSKDFNEVKKMILVK